MTLTFGIEIETCNVDYPVVKRELDRLGVKGFLSKYDGTPAVDAEIVLAPITLCAVGKEYIQNICNALTRIGCGVNRECGLHVHVGNAELDTSISNAVDYTTKSIRHLHENRSFLSQHKSETIPFVVWSDVSWRWQRQQDTINTMFPRSRTNNRYCMPLRADTVSNANTIEQLNHGKFFAINFETWRNGTVEFRQHSGTVEFDKIWNWLNFLNNFISWTIEHRVEHGERTIVQDTPVMPFRAGARVGVQYTMMRTNNGATTREIMDATGCSEQRVRAAVSEIRQRVGDSAVVTHTQQANGASYGSGTDHTRYQVLETVETQSDGATIMPENRIGIPSIWAGLDDSDYELWQNRITSLR